MTVRFCCIWLSSTVLSLLATAASSLAQNPAPSWEVVVTQPVTRMVTDYYDSSAETEASGQVEVRARVTGSLVKVHFKDGFKVKKGDVLFEIDPRLYEIELEKANGEVDRSEARLKRANDRRKRLSLVPRGGEPPQGFDQFINDCAEAEAELRIARANRDRAKHNLSFTKVTARRCPAASTVA